MGKKLGDCTVEELLDSADKDARYLGERLHKQVLDRGANPDDIEEVINSALITQLRSCLIVAQSRIREHNQARPEAATIPTTPDPERSERQAAEAMTGHLVALRVPAQTINTGGNCWATSIPLTSHARLELNYAPGEPWSWSLYHYVVGQVVCGHWDSADDQTVAGKAHALIHAMGSIVA